eukprot:930184-Prymnesium_polylepis.1
MSLRALPADVVTEIAIRASLSALRAVVRFDVSFAASTRIQRFLRDRWRRRRGALQVGDRVAVRGGEPALQYATVAAVKGDVCKLLQLDRSYTRVQRHRVQPLEPWADGPWAETVGQVSAVAAASAAQQAASHATSMAMAAMSCANSAETALAMAAASAASTAAAAASAASMAAVAMGPNDDGTLHTTATSSAMSAAGSSAPYTTSPELGGSTQAEQLLSAAQHVERVILADADAVLPLSPHST